MNSIKQKEKAQADAAELRRLLHQNRETERRHIASELHDGPLQELAGLSMELALLAHTLTNEDTTAYVLGLRTRQERIAQQLRAINQSLRPPVLVHFGLLVAIRTHTESLRALPDHPQISTELAEEINPIPEEISIPLFRICEHALKNVLQHARAQTIYVRLQEKSQQLHLEIEDDGCGFALPTRWLEFARSGHLGLVTMMEYAEASGAQFEIHSQPGTGTLIRVYLTTPTS
jgi:signal transduction histidine kinase